jgi:hypothetical protein
MTVFPSPLTLSFFITSYNHNVALALFAGLLWHVTCDLDNQQNMNSVVLSANFE